MGLATNQFGVGNLDLPLSSLTNMGYAAGVTITRPSNTTAYTAGDVIGQADATVAANAGTGILEFTSIGPSNGHAYITDVRLQVDVAAVPSGMAGFKLHLYATAPDAILDNAAWDLASAGDRGKYKGCLTIPTPADLGSTLYVDVSQINKKITLTGTSLFAVLVTDGGFTPASGTVKRVMLHTVAV